MVASSSHGLTPAPETHRLRDVFLLTAVLAAAATALIFGLRYAAGENDRELGFWSARLDGAVQAGARTIGKLAEAQTADLLELADNASLRIYLWNVLNEAPGTDAATVGLDYLRGLLVASTDQGTRAQARNEGFLAVAILDTALGTVYATPASNLNTVALQIAGQALDTKTRQLILTEPVGGKARIVFAVPVAPPPGAAGQGKLAGVLLAEVDAADLLLPVISSLPGYFDSDTSLLIGATGTPLVVLTGAVPLTDTTQPISRGFSVAAATGGATILQASQRVPGTGWTLVRRVSGELGLQAVRQRIAARWVALVLSVAALASVLWAWREHSIRLRERAQMLPMVMGQAGFGGNSPENQLLNKLVASLIDVIDLHDPYSAFHSARLAELCRAIGTDMGLAQDGINTLVTAAMLANVGKISLPRELLTKRDELSEPEHELLQTHVEEGVEILRRLDFEDPVLAAIAQKQEKLDGSGYPHGISADRITLPGRILAVANAYVALVSPRAYRDALSSDEALEAISRDVGSVYDQQAYDALERVIDNGIGLTDWDMHMGNPA